MNIEPLCITRMKNILFTIAVSLFSVQVWSSSTIYTLYSPDRNIKVSVSTQTGRLSWAVSYNRNSVVEPSDLGLTVDGHDLGYRTELVGTPVRLSIDETYPIMGNHSHAVNRANEVALPLKGDGVHFELIVRAYNDGVALRYALPDGADSISMESTSWCFSKHILKAAWTTAKDGYEGISKVTAWNRIPDSTAIAGPVSLQLPHCFVTVTEADCETFADMALRRSGYELKACFPAAPHGWKLLKGDSTNGVPDGTYRGRKVSPWRVMAIARDLNGLVNTDLLTNLCPAPQEGTRFDWVKPGRCLWHWWSSGAPKIEEQRSWYDAAARLRWEYYLIDEGWSKWKRGEMDQWDLLKECIDYGRSVGVSTLVWADSKELRTPEQRRAYLQKVKDSGAAGIKIDFLPQPTAQVMRWYMEAMKECSEMGLLLNLHGCVKPTGLSRLFPNQLTREAVRGNEYQIVRYNRTLPFAHTVSLPFTRYMAGAADFTPMILNPDELQSMHYTWANQMAQVIVYLSPIVHFADHYRFYLNSPMVDLLRDIPTVWDETRLLPCTEMGVVVAYARRKGNEWWIGIMNGDTKQIVDLDLDFLCPGQHQMSIVTDKEGGSNTEVSKTERTVIATDKLHISMEPGGGFVARIH